MIAIHRGWPKAWGWEIKDSNERADTCRPANTHTVCCWGPLTAVKVSVQWSRQGCRQRGSWGKTCLIHVYKSSLFSPLLCSCVLVHLLCERHGFYRCVVQPCWASHHQANTHTHTHTHTQSQEASSHLGQSWVQIHLNDTPTLERGGKNRE